MKNLVLSVGGRGVWSAGNHALANEGINWIFAEEREKKIKNRRVEQIEGK